MPSPIFDPLTIPTPAEPGQIANLPWWHSIRFTWPNRDKITCNADQSSQTITQKSSDPSPVFSPPYPTGTVYLTQEELEAIPGVEEFFKGLLTLLNQKVVSQNIPEDPYAEYGDGTGPDPVL